MDRPQNVCLVLKKTPFLVDSPVPQRIPVRIDRP